MGKKYRINKAALMIRMEVIGNLTADAAKAQSPCNGEPYISFCVACNPSNPEKQSTYYIEARYRYTGVFQFLQKSKRVFLEGIPELSVRTRKDGTQEVRTVLHVQTLELLGTSDRKDFRVNNDIEQL